MEARQARLAGSLQVRHFPRQPGILIALIDVHRTAHANDAIDIIQIGRNELPIVKLDRPQIMSIVLKHRTEDGRTLIGMMLENQEAHRLAASLTVGRNRVKYSPE